MARLYDTNDLFFSFEGDFDVDESGDLRDTLYDPLRSIRQQILTRVKSEKGDWQYQGSIGANLSNFVGEPNSRETGMAIKNAVRVALGQHALVDLNGVKIDVMPISRTMIALRVEVAYLRTSENSVSDPLLLNFLYDYIDNNIYPTAERSPS
tara:strand:- start:79579 stop:80034 length:456 start_codon:yes stop_codon:yes gene_type:complete